MSACPFDVGDRVDIFGVCGTVVRRTGVILIIRNDQGNEAPFNCADASPCQHSVGPVGAGRRAAAAGASRTSAKRKAAKKAAKKPIKKKAKKATTKKPTAKKKKSARRGGR